MYDTGTYVYARTFGLGSGARKKGELPWDMKRCAICAAKILAEAPKDSAREFFIAKALLMAKDCMKA